MTTRIFIEKLINEGVRNNHAELIVAKFKQMFAEILKHLADGERPHSGRSIITWSM